MKFKTSLAAGMMQVLCVPLICLSVGCASKPPQGQAVETAQEPPPPPPAVQVVQPEIDVKRVIFGPADAPITIVEYLDFQCGACQVGAATLKPILAKYKDHVRLVVKHMPLNQHPQAKPAAQAFETLRRRSYKRALAFYDRVLEDRGRISTPEDLDKILKEFKLSRKQLNKDADRLGVTATLKKDRDEFIAFGFRGTPAILVNGQVFAGVPDPEEIEKIILSVVQGPAKTNGGPPSN